MTRKYRSKLIIAGVLIPVMCATQAAAQGMSEAPGHHEPLVGHVLVDQLEQRWQDGEESVDWSAQAWYGGDYHKLWLKTEGEYRDDEIEEAEVQLLYSRLISHFWDVQAGVRRDFRPEPARSYGVIGLQGLAPGLFELDLQGFLSTEGDVSARVEAEYDLLITQRLILQPALEINAAAQTVEELGIGSGINDVELGLRLRYEIKREFSPYIGVSWNKKLGNTADIAHREGESTDDFAIVAGLRVWF